MVTGKASPSSSGSSRMNEWCADSAANRHVCMNKELFDQYIERKSLVFTGTNEGAEVLGEGTIRLRTFINNKESFVTLTNVIHCPSIKRNLISIGGVDSKGVKSVFGDGKVSMIKNGKLILFGEKCVEDSRLHILTNTYAVPSKVMLTEENRTLNEWHKTLGHADRKAIGEMQNKEAVTGFKIQDRQSCQACSTCTAAKITRASHPQRDVETTEVGELLDMELIGRIPIKGISGKHYALIIRNRFSKYNFVRLLHTKDETADKLQNIIGV